MAGKIIEYYKKEKEYRRLRTGTSRLERVRTESFLRRFLPESPAVVADIGGGTGPYAFMLTKRGYSVHLIDLTSTHTEKAKSIEKTSGHHLASISVGDARNIGLNNQSVDVVLFLGPLYHITEREDRIKALKEAYRILKPNGLIFAVGISRFASFIDGIRSGYISDPDFVSIIKQDLENGEHRNLTNKPFYFTTAFFHHPNELKLELEDSGFLIKSELAIEGLLG